MHTTNVKGMVMVTQGINSLEIWMVCDLGSTVNIPVPKTAYDKQY